MLLTPYHGSCPVSISHMIIAQLYTSCGCMGKSSAHRALNIIIIIIIITRRVGARPTVLQLGKSLAEPCTQYVAKCWRTTCWMHVPNHAVRVGGPCVVDAECPQVGMASGMEQKKSGMGQKKTGPLIPRHPHVPCPQHSFWLQRGGGAGEKRTHSENHECVRLITRASGRQGGPQRTALGVMVLFWKHSGAICARR